MLAIIVIIGTKSTFKRTVVLHRNASYTLFFSKISFTLITYLYSVLERSEHLVSVQYFEYIEVKYHLW